MGEGNKSQNESKFDLNIKVDPDQKVTPINLDPTNQQQMLQATLHSVKTPFLPPDFLEGYEKTLPGAAREIFDLIHEEQKFQMELKRKEIEFLDRNLTRAETIDAANIREQDSLNTARNRELDIKSRGQVFAFLIAIILIAAAFGFSWMDKPWLSGICLTLMATMAIILFLQKAVTHEKAEEKIPESQE